MPMRSAPRVASGGRRGRARVAVRVMSEPLRILAAGSLRAPFERLAAGSPGELAMGFANARVLAGRIEAAEPADVFASASAEHPNELHRKQLASAPRAFAINRVVVAVRSDSPIADIAALATPGLRLAIEVAGIPLGDYTRTMLARMDGVAGAGFSARALANVVAEEVVVDAVVARLVDGDADLGVLYSTDVVARADQLRAIEIPSGAAVQGTYCACAVAATAQEARATTWLDALLEAPAQAILRDAGFLPVDQSA
jgi:molybdate transport system substrate-binding protein